jgi:hypothetical protein
LTSPFEVIAQMWLALFLGSLHYRFPKHWECYSSSQCVGSQKSFPI